MTDQEYFCAAAWTAIYLDPDGTVDFCCTAKNNLGNIKDQSIKEILSSPRVKELREKMLNNEPVQGCSACWRQEKEHRMQTFFNNKYLVQQQISRTKTFDPGLDEDFFKSVDNSKPKYLDLRWNNTCNFACIYCGDRYSSLWAEQKQKYQPYLPIVNKPAQVNKNDLYDYLDNAFTSVDWIYFAGGEPLAIKENSRILDQLYQVNPNCTLQINTNLSMLDGNPIFDRLKKFPNVRWMISGEAIGEIFEYIRWPGNWLTFTKNLKTIADLRRIGHEMTFNLVAMNINHTSLWHYVDYILDLDLVNKPSDINLNLYNMRESSHPFSIQRMPVAWKNETRNLLAKRNYDIRGVDNYIDALDDPLPSNANGWQGLEYSVERLRFLDTQRGLDSKQIFPHVYEFINDHPR